MMKEILSERQWIANLKEDDKIAELLCIKRTCAKGHLASTSTLWLDVVVSNVKRTKWLTISLEVICWPFQYVRVS